MMTEYAFCPNCLEECSISEDTNECTNCGGRIPDGIIDLETSRKEAIIMAKEIIKKLDWYKEVRGSDGSLNSIRELVEKFLGEEA